MRIFLKIISWFLFLSALLYCGLFWLLRNPIFWPKTTTTLGLLASIERLEKDVSYLSAITPSRSFHNPEALDKAGDYIEAQFAEVGCKPRRQTYTVNAAQYHNIICSIGPQSGSALIFGAHYDVAGDNNPGADDNASGVAGILELTRILSNQKTILNQRIDLVAYTLEEPPNFKTSNMGSYVYAEKLVNEGVKVDLSISVEMTGFFSDVKGSQHYPLSVLKLFYPDRANFIAVVGAMFDRQNVSRVKALMSRAIKLPVYSINAPASVPGVDFSDHWSFWQHELPAVMVSDTAFLRNPNYHHPTDLPETLDYGRMAEVVTGLYAVAVEYKKLMH